MIETPSTDTEAAPPGGSEQLFLPVDGSLTLPNLEHLFPLEAGGALNPNHPSGAAPALPAYAVIEDWKKWFLTVFNEKLETFKELQAAFGKEQAAFWKEQAALQKKQAEDALRTAINLVQKTAGKGQQAASVGDLAASLGDETAGIVAPFWSSTSHENHIGAILDRMEEKIQALDRDSFDAYLAGDKVESHRLRDEMHRLSDAAGAVERAAGEGV